MSDRVLVLMPRGPATSRTCKSLASLGMTVCRCRSLDQVCRKLDEDPAAAVIAEACLGPSGVGRLAEAMRGRPSRPDFPVVVLGDCAPSGEDVRARLDRFEPLGNAVLLERPVRLATIVSTLRAVLAGRKPGIDRPAAAPDRGMIDRHERCRLARLVHDDLQQILVAAKLHAGMVRRQAQDGQCQDGWEEVVGLLDRAIDTTRSLSEELCPPALADSHVYRKARNRNGHAEVSSTDCRRPSLDAPRHGRVGPRRNGP